MYIKPPGMAAAEEGAKRSEAKSRQGDAGPSTQGDAGPRRHTRPKNASERGQGADLTSVLTNCAGLLMITV
jgi:hypothetical protein